MLDFNHREEASEQMEEVEALERSFEFKGERFQAPPELWDAEKNCLNAEAATKRAMDLRKQLGAKPSVPEAYELSLAEELSGKVEISQEHPLVKSSMEWAKKVGLSQEQFTELTALYAQNTAQETLELEGYYQEQEQILFEKLGDHASTQKQKIASWVVGVVGEDPEMLSVAEALSTEANGVLFLKRMMEHLKEPSVPSSKGIEAGKQLSLDDLKKKQASKAYLDPLHPDHNRIRDEVNASYQTLF